MENDIEKKQIESDVASQKVITSTRIAAEDLEMARLKQIQLSSMLAKEELKSILFEFFGKDTDPKRRSVLIERVPFICEDVKGIHKSQDEINKNIREIQSLLQRVEPVLQAYDREKAGKEYVSQKTKFVIAIAAVLAAVMAIVGFIKMLLK